MAKKIDCTCKFKNFASNFECDNAHVHTEQFVNNEVNFLPILCIANI